MILNWVCSSGRLNKLARPKNHLVWFKDSANLIPLQFSQFMMHKVLAIVQNVVDMFFPYFCRQNIQNSLTFLCRNFKSLI